MKHSNISLFIVLSISLCLTACTNSNKKATTNKEEDIQKTKEEIIVRGKYLVTIMGCHDCHSPKKMGPNGPELIPELLLSGYPSDRPIIKFSNPLLKEGFGMFYPDLTAAAGPWGVSFAANLTPDPTGIGTWTEAQFKKALTEGKFKGLDGTRMLLPPMPWFNFTELKNEDVNAIFAYLNSIKPVRNVVPAPVPPNEM
uniref:c-type cytochrome n=1 Tax=uncultured Draconibacterium sp. TaxID=1573823 RepID=UPI003216B18B